MVYTYYELPGIENLSSTMTRYIEYSIYYTQQRVVPEAQFIRDANNNEQSISIIAAAIFTVIAPLAVVDGILPEGELLQISVGLSQEADDEETGTSTVQCRHCLRCWWYLVPRRVDDYHRQTDHVHPHRLFIYTRKTRYIYSPAFISYMCMCVLQLYEPGFIATG